MKGLVTSFGAAIKAKARKAFTRTLQLSLFQDAAAAPPQRSVAAAPPPIATLASDASEPGFDSLCRGEFAHVRVAVRTRLRDTWRVKWIRRTESLEVEVPRRLAAAPMDIKRALLQWAVLVSARRRRRDPVRRMLRGELEKSIREFLASRENDAAAARRRRERNLRRLRRLQPKGIWHDLDAAFAAINRDYFDGKLSARLTWSRRLGCLSTHSLAEDADGAAYHLISISRGYDSPEVTPEILGGVVYHESLHIAIPPRTVAGRRIVHGSDFRVRERQYTHYEVWRRWHREGLPKALRRLKRGRGK